MDGGIGRGVLYVRTGCRDFDNDIVWVLDLGHLDLLDRDLEGALVVHGFHLVAHVFRCSASYCSFRSLLVSS